MRVERRELETPNNAYLVGPVHFTHESHEGLVNIDSHLGRCLDISAIPLLGKRAPFRTLDLTLVLEIAFASANNHGKIISAPDL